MAIKTSIRAAIIGAAGYSGGELIRLLARHPNVEIDALFGNSTVGKAVADTYPWFRKKSGMKFEQYSLEAVKNSDVVFIALPSGQAMNIVPEILASGKKVIDLGGDFRLQDTVQYKEYYGQEHTAALLLPEAVYGLSEWNKPAIASASLVANPGCYPTSILLPLVPLLKTNVIAKSGIVINSLSGVSGAGRRATADLSFAEVNESVRAYKIGKHQHIPEIASVIKDITGDDASFSFVPHLIPITRGIASTISAMLPKGIGEADIANAYANAYSGAAFVQVYTNKMPEIKDIVNTNDTLIGYSIYPGTGQIIIHSVIDNLVKGAAGQAVQNMNIMCGFDECTALL